MTLALVPRSVRALSDHINAYYRVLRGQDQDSVFLRLAALGGSFEVRHSATNAPVFKVTDAGVQGIIQGGDVVDGTITTAELAANAVTTDKILDGTIVNADVNAAADIAVTKVAHVGANNVLRSNGTANVGGQVVNADVAAGAAIAYSKLNLASSVTSADLVDGTIVNGDVNAAANIAVAKVAHVGANNVLRSNGTANVGGQVVNADVDPAAAIAVAKVAHVGANNVLRSNGTANVGGQVVNADVSSSAAIAYSKLNLASSITTGDIVDGTIVNGDVDAAANIAVTKVAHVGANNVLKSTGTANVGGQVVNADVSSSAAIAYSKLSLSNSIVNADVNASAAVALSKLAPGTSGVLKSNGTTISAGNSIITGDMVVNTINGDRITDSTITAAKILGGAPPPNGAGAADAYKAYATAAAGTTVTLQKVATEHLATDAVHRVFSVNGSASSPTIGVSGALLDDMSIAFTPIGTPLLLLFTGTFMSNTNGATIGVNYYRDNVDQGVGRASNSVATSYPVTITLSFVVMAPPTAAAAYQIYWSNSVGVATAYSTWRTFTIIEFKR